MGLGDLASDPGLLLTELCHQTSQTRQGPWSKEFEMMEHGAAVAAGVGPVAAVV